MDERNLRLRALRVLILLTGIFFMLGAVVLFLPAAWMRSVANFFLGEGEGAKAWPEKGPAFLEYLIRAAAASCAWFGLFFLAAWRDPLRHRRIVVLCIVGLLLLGTALHAAGASVGLPARWYLGDALFCFVTGVAILLLLPPEETGEPQ